MDLVSTEQRLSVSLPLLVSGVREALQIISIIAVLELTPACVYYFQQQLKLRLRLQFKREGNPMSEIDDIKNIPEAAWK